MPRYLTFGELVDGQSMKYNDRIALRYAAAVRDHREGRIDAAAEKYREILMQVPAHADALHMLGVIASGQGNGLDAFNYFQKAIASAPQNAQFRNNLGVSARALGRSHDAEAAFRAALSIDSALVDPRCNLGNLLSDCGAFEEAWDQYKMVLDCEPQHAAARLGLAQICRHRGNLDEAVAIYGALAQDFPDNSTVRNNLGVVKMECGAIEAALQEYQIALRLDPNNLETLNNISVACLAQGNAVAAEKTLRHLLSLQPEAVEAHGNLGNALRRQGRYDEAASCYRTALQIRPDAGVQLRLATLLPVIPSSAAALHDSRRKLEAAIDKLISDKISIDDPVNDVGITHFHLSYHDTCNRDLNTKIARLYAAACPTLNFIAPHCKKAINRMKRKLKVGFVSRYLRDHAVGWCYHRILRQMPCEKLSVSAFTFYDDDDPLWAAIAADVDNAVILPASLPRAREQIAKEKLDVLIYTDIGMEPLSYFLAFARLAPIQCVTNGHPDTTGISTIDYFISSEPLESHDASSHYSESLAALHGVLVDYDRPEVPAPLKPHSAFNLPDNATLYVCPQSLFKLHPDMDMAFAEILARDTDARLVFFEGPEPNWAKLLHQRWHISLGRNIDRIQFIERQTYSDFLNIIRLSDVILDTWPFSGGNTTYQAFAMGVPIVTFPGRFARGRSTMALYQRMGISDLIAVSAEDYAEIALGLGMNPAWRSEIAARIQHQSGVLFGDRGAVEQFAQFLLGASEQAGRVS